MRPVAGKRPFRKRKHAEFLERLTHYMPRSMSRKPGKGCLVTLEGTDGSGKSTLAVLIEKFFREKGIAAVKTVDPGGTPAGEKIRKLILERDAGGRSLDPWAEAFLYLASRRQLVAEVIRPGLEKGHVVICDRFTDSTIAYQGFGRGLELDYLLEACAKAADGIRPDLTLWLDIEPSEGLGRIKNADRMESAGSAFQERVREGYRFQAGKEPGRFRRIEPGQTPGDTFRAAKKELDVLLSALGQRPREAPEKQDPG